MAMLNRMIKLALSTAFYGFRQGSRLLNKKGANCLTVVTYHAIKREETDKFARQMDQILNLGRPVLANTASPASPVQPLIAVTFDDGFQSFFQRALPVLLAKGVPTTVFVSTGYIGRRAGWVTLKRHRLFDELVMTKGQIAEAANAGVLVGSHSVSHTRLADVAREKALEELVTSKKELENLLGRKVDLLSLPYGSWDRGVIRLAKHAGYKKVFLNIPLKATPKSRGSVVGRIDISMDDSVAESGLKFLGAYSWLPYAIRAKRRVIIGHGRSETL